MVNFKPVELFLKINMEIYLARMDLKLLYINIPNSEGKGATKRSLDKQTNKTWATKFIIIFLTIILTLTDFIFNRINYPQIKAYVMGTIFVTEFGSKYKYLIKTVLMLYLLFIDDIFMIWKRTLP